ncbi:MAG: RHS domain-containing protein, partial [Deltaproteobacteria bacterium]|nr:RHS domain-containing protein [Deltaproteobacteria bacterium]
IVEFGNPDALVSGGSILLGVGFVGMVSGFGLGGLFRGSLRGGRRRGGFVCLAAAMTLAVTAVPAPAFAPVRSAQAAMPRAQADAVPIAPCLDTGEVSLGGEYDVYYIHTDHRGAPVFLTDESADVVWTTEYDPFGNALCDWGRVHQDATGRTECVPNDWVSGERVEMNLRLPGQYYDEESGLHYNWHRYYDPKIGRYLTPDSYILSVNKYIYAHNNPLLYVDFEGSHPAAVAAAAAWELIEGFNDSSAFVWDVMDLINGGYCNLSDWLWTGWDALSLALPGLPALGLIGKPGRFDDVMDALDKWLGPGARTRFNKANDWFRQSEDELKQVRFDKNNPSPHDKPHLHVTEWSPDGEEILNRRYFIDE